MISIWADIFNRLRTARQALRFHSGARILALSMLISFLQPAPIITLAGPQQHVKSTIPILGVHTRLTDEVEPWKVKRSLEMVREMGAGWIVEFFPWAYYHAEDGGFAWDHPDLVIEHANAQGLKVVARLGYTPEWARPEDSPLTYLDENAYEDFAEFASAFASRYQGKVSHLIIWNEPNLSYEWGYRTTSPADYVDLLKIVYPRVKEVNPDVQVLAGALAPTLEPAGSPWGLNDLTYLDGMYDAGAAEFFDGLAVHAYGLAFPPESEPNLDLLNFRRVELIREVMLAHEDSQKRIMITETGWNDHPRWTLAVKPAQRIKFTIDALEFARQNWSYVDLVALWAFRFPAEIKSYMDYYTFVSPEFVAKPIYSAIQSFTGNSGVSDLD